MSKLKVENLKVDYLNKKEIVTAINNINFKVEENQFVVIVGPSGSGKTTILKSILGLVEYEGDIYIDNVSEKETSYVEKNISYITQNTVLQPHLSIFENIAFSLTMEKVPFKEIKERVNSVANILDITYLLTRKPKQLSGGQQQKILLAKALIKKPRLSLFDEPFSNLDNVSKIELRHFLKKLHSNTNLTFIMATHDQKDAFALADKLIILNNGNIEQIGKPLEVLNNPKNNFVKEFLNVGVNGETNI